MAAPASESSFKLFSQRSNIPASIAKYPSRFPIHASFWEPRLRAEKSTFSGLVAIVLCKAIVSAIFRPMGPEVDNGLWSDGFPVTRSTVSTVGRKPITLLKAPGFRSEPMKSLPSATGSICAPSALAAPPLDPPAVSFGFQALPVGPKIGLYDWEPKPNSGTLVLPMNMAPAARSLAAKVLSWSAIRSANIGEPLVWRSPATGCKSFTACGMPCIQPR